MTPVVVIIMGIRSGFVKDEIIKMTQHIRIITANMKFDVAIA